MPSQKRLCLSPYVKNEGLGFNIEIHSFSFAAPLPDYLYVIVPAFLDMMNLIAVLFVIIYT
jgi:hypothetical protein